jgi:hypothetical protein
MRNLSTLFLIVCGIVGPATGAESPTILVFGDSLSAG